MRSLCVPRDAPAAEQKLIAFLLTSNSLLFVALQMIGLQKVLGADKKSDMPITFEAALRCCDRLYSRSQSLDADLCVVLVKLAFPQRELQATRLPISEKVALEEVKGRKCVFLGVCPSNLAEVAAVASYVSVVDHRHATTEAIRELLKPSGPWKNGMPNNVEVYVDTCNKHATSTFVFNLLGVRGLSPLNSVEFSDAVVLLVQLVDIARKRTRGYSQEMTNEDLAIELMVKDHPGWEGVLTLLKQPKHTVVEAGVKLLEKHRAEIAAAAKEPPTGYVIRPCLGYNILYIKLLPGQWNVPSALPEALAAVARTRDVHAIAGVIREADKVTGKPTTRFFLRRPLGSILDTSEKIATKIKEVGGYPATGGGLPEASGVQVAGPVDYLDEPPAAASAAAKK